MIDFPNAPTVGQYHNDWQWNGVTWVFNRSGFTYVGDAAPTGAFPGQTWYQSSTNISYVWTTMWVPFTPSSVPSANQIPFTPQTSVDPYVPAISATNVQAAVEEVVTDTAANYALGIVATGILPFRQAATIAASVDTAVTDLLSFTPLVGRQYRLKCKFRVAYPTAAAGYAYLRCVGTNNLGAADTITWLGGVHHWMEMEQIFIGTGTPSTYQVNVIAAVAIAIYTEQPVSFFHIQDVGPAR